MNDSRILRILSFKGKPFLRENWLASAKLAYCLSANIHELGWERKQGNKAPSVEQFCEWNNETAQHLPHAETLVNMLNASRYGIIQYDRRISSAEKQVSAASGKAVASSRGCPFVVIIGTYGVATSDWISLDHIPLPVRVCFCPYFFPESITNIVLLPATLKLKPYETRTNSRRMFVLLQR